jgi:hypothetical protein
MGPSFLDLQVDKNGKPYGPKRFKEIVKECWYISDNLHTSYTDVLDLSFQERFYLIELINEKQENTRKAIEAKQAELQQNRK